MATYKVQKGDCLWSIAAKQLGSGLKWQWLAKINGISIDKPTLQIGQVLKLDSGDGNQPSSLSNKTNSIPVIQYFGLQAGTDSTVFAAWSWSKSNTENYKVVWYYDTGNGLWFVGNDSTTTDKQSVYSAPSNAKRVKFKVKAISKKKTVNKKEVSYWTCGWSTAKTYDFKNNPPSKPSAPTVEIDKYKLTAELDNLDINAKQVQFEVVKDNKTVFKTGTATITKTHASFSCTVNAGGEYKVRCRGVRDKVYGEWSEYSSNVSTIPSAPSKITKIKANSETSVYLEWSKVSNATSYDIEYSTSKSYFDGSDKTTTITGVEFTHYEKTGLESGDEYFFRVRATNSQGSSGWCGIKSVVIGKKPSAPTTWSSTTTAIVGEPMVLYWVHNTEDGSSQFKAEVEITVGSNKTVKTITSSGSDEDLDKTYSYSINTSSYPEGTKILWRVRTAGVTKVYGDWSIQRTIDVYAPPTLSLNMNDSSGNAIHTLTTFPFFISASAFPNTQSPIGYHLAISANEAYETVDNVGNVKMVNAGEQVYSKYFDITSSLLVQFMPSNIDLENNIEYTITCVVAMNSGLNATQTHTFEVSWTDLEFEPNAEISIDEETASAYVRPFCEDYDGTLVPDITLSVYRREFDGTFTELMTGINNEKTTFITDPHPSLDYARYRVVAITNSTGAVSYYDVPGYPVGEKAVIIQWDDEWSTFDTNTEDELEQPPWSGSLLRLLYNIDVSDNHDVDVELVKYIGRKNPVAYYGTQLGSTATWSMEIPKSDKDTLYQLRRLAIYTGDVYVREPSGSGYWANISVSFSQKHTSLTIPISLDITRVEGGV